MEEQSPVRKFRAGSVSCAVWQNEMQVAGRTVPVLKASVERSYQAKDGVWKSSRSFGRNEIPLVIYCLQQAFAFMIEQGAETRQADINRVGEWATGKLG